MSIFPFHSNFSVESTEAYTESTEPTAKSPIIPPPDIRLNFLLKGQHTKPPIACSRLNVSTSNNENPVKERGLVQVTNRPICFRKNCLKSKANKQELTKQKRELGKAFYSSLKKKPKEAGDPLAGLI